MSSYFYEICSKISPWPCWCWGSPWGWGGDGPSAPPSCPWGPEKIQMTNLIMPNNMSSTKYAKKPVPGPAYVGVPPGDGDGPSALQMSRGSGKNSKWIILLCLTIVFYEICSKISPWPCWYWGPPWWHGLLQNWSQRVLIKKVATMLFSMKNWRGRVGNIFPKG